MSIGSRNERQEVVALKKALEWELSLDSRDLRSHAWYHGLLPRQRAEEIVVSERDFLVRDCTSQPDNYVLSCRSKAAVLHFVINKILLQPKTVYERMQYQFEDDAFDTVADLITYYVGSGKAISAASGACIKFPCNRTYPLSFYGYKIIGNPLNTQMLAGISGQSPFNSPLGNEIKYNPAAAQQLSQREQHRRHMLSPPMIKRDITSQLSSKKKNSQSVVHAQATIDSNIQLADSAFQTRKIMDGGSLINEEVEVFSTTEKSKTTCCAPIDAHLQSHWKQFHSNEIQSNGFQTIARTNVGDIIDFFKFSTHSLPRPTTNTFRYNQPNFLEFKGKPQFPPPKPRRSNESSWKQLNIEWISRMENNIHLELQQNVSHRDSSYHTNGSDSGNGSGDSLLISTPGDMNESCQHRGVIIMNPRFIANSTYSMTLKSLTEFDAAFVEEQLLALDISEIELGSMFDVENYNTLLLPSVDNKPLDRDALFNFKTMLLENGSKIISEHMTLIDINLLIEEHRDKESNVLQCAGLEIMMLPHGKIFRNDLIERIQCIKLLVAVTILTCQTDLNRAELLSKWIEVAVYTKTALGNLFGFSGIMLGLCMPQIQKLDPAWHILRQKHTNNAFLFESKLRPILNSMNECTNPQAPNTTIPHILPYILLKDGPSIDIVNIPNCSERSSLYTTCITSWESKAEDFGMFTNFEHLDSARNFLKNLDSYKKNGKMLLEGANLYHDELLSDAFRTEFHIKFLWGSTCTVTTPEERHFKLEKVLEMMGNKFCNVDSIDIFD